MTNMHTEQEMALKVGKLYMAKRSCGLLASTAYDHRDKSAKSLAIRLSEDETVLLYLGKYVAGMDDGYAVYVFLVDKVYIQLTIVGLNTYLKY